jgi:tol-pal system protein YbgF
MMRAAVLLLALLCLAAPASAQSAQEVGQMRLYIQQLEERLRQLTGQNEQLTYQLNQLRAQAGQPGASAQTGAAGQGGTILTQPSASTTTGTQAGLQPGTVGAAAPPQDIGTYSISPDDPLISPDGGDHGEPVDLSVLAGGGGAATDPNGGFATPVAPQTSAEGQTAVLSNPEPTAALTGSARDEYDLAYGYILTGEYESAEQSFQRWLAAFPGDPQAADAQFWLAESLYQQGDYRDAANAFLAVYKGAQQSPKAPDALLKLGMSLSALVRRMPPAPLLVKSSGNIRALRPP